MFILVDCGEEVGIGVTVGVGDDNGVNDNGVGDEVSVRDGLATGWNVTGDGDITDVGVRLGDTDGDTETY